MSITSLEELNPIAKEKTRDGFVYNSKKIMEKLYKVEKKYDGLGNYKGYYLENQDNNNLHNKDKKILAEKVFATYGYKMIYDFFGICPFTTKPEIIFDGVPLASETYSVKHYEYLELNELHLLTAIEEYEPVIMVNNENIAHDCAMSADILSKYYFNPGIMTAIQFKYKANIDPWVIIEYSDRYLKCKVYALKKNEEYPLWIEYLIMSWSLYEVGNERMAFLTAFASLDYYIEMQYSKLKEIYKKLACDVVNEELIDETIKQYNTYCNLQRRIIEDKFKDILKARVENVDVYSDIHEKLYKYEKIRNAVAHCEDKYVEGQYKSLVFTILRAMYITTFDKDIDNIFEVVDE